MAVNILSLAPGMALVGFVPEGPAVIQSAAPCGPNLVMLTCRTPTGGVVQRVCSDLDALQFTISEPYVDPLGPQYPATHIDYNQATSQPSLEVPQFSPESQAWGVTALNNAPWAPPNPAIAQPYPVLDQPTYAWQGPSLRAGESRKTGVTVLIVVILVATFFASAYISFGPTGQSDLRGSWFRAYAGDVVASGGSIAPANGNNAVKTELPPEYGYLNNYASSVAELPECAKVMYKIAPDNLPELGVQAVEDAFRAASIFTGIPFILSDSDKTDAVRYNVSFVEKMSPELSGDAIGSARAFGNPTGFKYEIYFSEINLLAPWFERRLATPEYYDLAVGVVLHEIGHSLGLDHTAAQGSIMAPYASLSLPTARDRQAFAALNPGCPQ